jgi:hypothetical protein
MLVALPILFVIVLSAQLLLVNCEQWPSSNVRQLALLQDIEVGVFDGDVLGFEGGDDGVCEWGLSEGFSRAEDGALAHCPDQECDHKRIAAVSWFPHQIFKELLAVFISLLRTDLNFPPYSALTDEVHLLLDGDFTLSYNVHVIGRHPLAG